MATLKQQKINKTQQKFKRNNSCVKCANLVDFYAMSGKCKIGEFKVEAAYDFSCDIFTAKK